MDELKRGYHITKKSKLYYIQKNGLKPKIGLRSSSIYEFKKRVYFTPQLDSIPIWSKKLYPEENLDDLAILAFDLDSVKHENREDSNGDFFTESVISPENIMLIQFFKKNNPREIVSLENLKDIIMDISRNNENSNYGIIEKKITELSLEKPTIASDKKEKLIHKLAEYEHDRMRNQLSTFFRIVNSYNLNSYDDLIVKREDFEGFCNPNYQQSNEKTKREIERDVRSSVIEGFAIIEENNMKDKLGVSDEELMLALEKAEYMRMSKWFKYMLSVGFTKDGNYIFPKEKVLFWDQYMMTPYNKLETSLKVANIREVKNIFLQIKKIRSNREMSEEQLK